MSRRASTRFRFFHWGSCDETRSAECAVHSNAQKLTVIRVLSDLGVQSLALFVYPGLVTMLVTGALMESVWTRLAGGRLKWDGLPRRTPSPVVITIALCSALAAAQLAAPFNPDPTQQRSVVIAAVALAFTPWVELALRGEGSAPPTLLLTVQVCWLLAVLGPAVQPESLPPQVLGNLSVPALLPVKVASAFLYLLCLPALLRLWPRATGGDRRDKPRFDLARMACWFAYCGLFTTLFFPPSASDLAGLARFLAVTSLVAVAAMVGGLVLGRRGYATARGLYMRAVPVYAGAVLLLVVATTLIMR